MISFKALAIGLRTFGKNSAYVIKRHAPHIMVGLGIAGFGVTAVASGKAAIKAKDILAKRDQDLHQIEMNRAQCPESEYSAEDYEQDKKIVRTQTVFNVGKAMLPPVTIGLASAFCILGGHHILGRRAAEALASAYAYQKKLNDYRGNVVEQFGEEIDKNLASGLPISKENIGEKMKEAEEKKAKQEEQKKETGDDYIFVDFFFDELTGRGVGYREDYPLGNYTKVKNAFLFSRDRLTIDGHLTINQILETEFHHPPITGGDYGWICDPNGFGEEKMEWIIQSGYGPVTGELFASDVGQTEFLQRGDSECIIIRFKVRERRIDQMYNQINSRKRAVLGY